MNWRIRLTWWDTLLLAIVAWGAVLALVRFAGGIGSVANINNAYPWGWWVGYGIMTMIAMGGVGFTITAFVEILGVQTGAVEVRLHRARRKLRDLLAGHEL